MSPVSDRRQHQRLPMEVEVELHQEGEPVRIVRTEDLSQGGVLLVLNGHARPAVGSRVQVRVCGLLGGGEAPPMVEATVVRHIEAGVAVQFMGDFGGE
ncbi:PilZ domain-containing protein [Thiorhodococcus mannitoliphagus]|uniref:PilZ domain-containing protein n=2 Tax=Thiorhodococcus mannitoliphagus TaxID=329406 RepID=A0A6P1DVG0_9GAMM|nr:PilZ domain-containing protein [Thiorhodococcus mannitoliphagus]NEX21183.1 PilZ domain-containing protein [Thiorhodococcus mannitoliphagus]